MFLGTQSQHYFKCSSMLKLTCPIQNKTVWLRFLDISLFFQLIIDSFSFRFLKSTCSRVIEGTCQNLKQLGLRNDNTGLMGTVVIRACNLFNGGHLKYVNSPFILFSFLQLSICLIPEISQSQNTFEVSIKRNSLGLGFRQGVLQGSILSPFLSKKCHQRCSLSGQQYLF